MQADQTTEIPDPTSILLFAQDVSTQNKALKAELADQKSKRQQAEASLAEVQKKIKAADEQSADMKKRSQEAAVALAAEQEAKRGLQAKLTAAERRQQTAEDTLRDVQKSNKAAAKVISLAACLSPWQCFVQVQASAIKYPTCD